MLHFIERVRRKLWNIWQPLTHNPKLMGSPVSDLFVWRNSEDWITFFELTDISGLFVDRDKMPDRYATFFFFDNDGALLLKKRVSLACNQRQTIDFSLFLAEFDCVLGTFSVFHSHTPQVVSDLGSYISERGYVSYRYMGAPLRVYVHGNHDAIAQLGNGSLQPLGGSSIRAREYRLQHALTGPALYEVGIVNHSSRSQCIYCKVFSIGSGAVLEVQEVKLKSRGCHVFPIKVDKLHISRIVIASHLVMARPLVFRINNHKLDVFHG